MRVFKLKSFARFARKEGISDTALADAVLEIENGMNVVDLGGGLMKKRVARTGGGKREGYRTVIAYQEGIRSVFLYGFPKNDKADLTDLELENLKKSANLYLRLKDADMDHALKAGEIKEVSYVNKKV